MDWKQVAFYILLGLLVVLVFLFVFVMSSLNSFKKKLIKREVAFSVLFSQKQEILLSIYCMFDTHKEDIKSSLIDLTTQVRWIKFENLNNNDIDKIASMLDELMKKLSRVGYKYPEYLKSKDYIICWNTLKDIDSNYRRNVAKYNSDIEGYEYWRTFWLFRPLISLFGFKKKNKVL